jgi:dTDP-4-dehydrorhamnose 3,5-epimerase
MRFLETEIPGVILVEPQVHSDTRGFFVETYHAPRYREGGIDAVFVQDNHSQSTRGTLRGLHGQFPRCQGKLLRVIQGEVFDVAVDVRRGSPAYGKHVAVSLSAENFLQIYIPPGFVHGFCVTSDVAQVEYKCTDVYRPEDEFGVAWNDPDLGIAWPVDDPILSPKDRDAPRLRDVQQQLIEF